MTVYIFVTIFVIEAIVKLMYTDNMTRVGYKAAYVENAKTLYRRMKNSEKFSFTVAVIDINDLKKINDTYGHESGDILIQNATSIVSLLCHYWCAIIQIIIFRYNYTLQGGQKYANYFRKPKGIIRSIV